jgi:hypothetical protein
VDEEIAPRAGGMVRRMNVKHRGGFLRRGGDWIGRSDRRIRRDGGDFRH